MVFRTSAAHLSEEPWAIEEAGRLSVDRFKYKM
jgi:hypothetical protein